jgi:hypothetical protein
MNSDATLLNSNEENGGSKEVDIPSALKREFPSNDKIIFAIYSCRKYQARAEFLYRLLEGRLPQDKVELWIFFGSDDQGPIESSCDHCILDCPDGYDNLTKKTLTLFSECLSYNGIIKCDDDIFPNLNYLRKFVDHVIVNKHIDYAGRRLDVKEHYGTSFVGKGNLRKPPLIPKCSYCAGPIYYLSWRTMHALVNSYNASSLVLNYNEDVTVGHNLGILGIEPTHNPLYCDDPSLYGKLNVQNINSRVPFLFMRLHGGLGNQLFQCASVYGIAKMTGRLPVLVFTESTAHYQHNKEIREYVDSVFKGMCCISCEYVCHLPFVYWSETDPKTLPDACFTNNVKLVAKIRAIQDPVFMNGYFQNENYFRNVKQMLLGHFYNPQVAAKIVAKYPRVFESYFIHVRRGDYVGNQLYNIDYDSYLKKALRHVLKHADEGVFTHFYVVSNDIEYCKSHPTFISNKNINVQFTILDDPAITPLETLHFMASCRMGGICANSSFSWWGSYFNSNPDKRVYFPYEWMTNITGPIDVYPDGALVIKCQKNK